MVKYMLVGFPAFILVVFFLIPFGMLIVSSFYINTPGAFYEPGFTVENYVRFFSSTFYLQKMWFTIQISLITAAICLFLGYPTAYYLARMRSNTKRNLYMMIIIGTLWVTYIVRAYAWRIVLAGVGPISQLLVSIGILNKPQSFAPGYWAIVIGLVYVFLPFMILSLYNSISNIKKELEEASATLGARDIETFYRVLIPLSKNGIISGLLLVFVLSLGVYVTSSILGNPSEWTLAIFIGDTITEQMNIPLGAAISIVLITLVVGSLGLMAKLTRGRNHRKEEPL